MRQDGERGRQGEAKRTLAVIIGLPVLYVASFGPACWAVAYNRNATTVAIHHELYWPLGMATDNRSTRFIFDGLCWYGSIGLPGNTTYRH